MMQTKRKEKITALLMAVLMMAVLSLVIVLGTMEIRQAVWGVYEETPPEVPTVVTTAPAALDGMDALRYHVKALYCCYDADSNLVAYRVETEETGYNAEQPITVATTVTTDARILVGMTVLKQKESEYYGARIATDEFAARFSGKYLPVVLTGTAGRGAHIDGISGATLSSNAVTDAVNHAWTFVRTYLAEGDNNYA